jgi:NTP pyrophosphatase (non-canonical NTP hydrolase)
MPADWLGAVSKMSDPDTTLADLRQHVTDFVAAREWGQFHTPKNLSAAIAIEAAELMELFQWLTDGQAAAAMEDEAQRAALADELADVLIYCLSLANALRVDVSTAILNKLERNESRFPAGHWRGRARE